tara:strand:+ start:52 stop:807 length:756 start_codon:yes stop_codon:yes gene_type:complete
MRICVSGTGSQGKSTFISDFLEEWSKYSTPKDTYRKFIKDKHSKKADKSTQWKILNSIIDELQKHDKDDHIIYDRGPLDNLVYTLWCFQKNKGKIDEKFVDKCIPLVRESFKLIDIIFYVPITRAATVEYDKDRFLEDKKKGICDEEYRIEVDNIFKALKHDWDVNHHSKFFDPRDKPAIIEIFGNPKERIEMCKLYLDKEGEALGGENAMDAILTEDQIRQEEEIKAQFGISDVQSEIYGNPEGELHGYQ